MSGTLSVPYVVQKNEWSCGAAAFEMVYRYLRPSRLSKLNADKLFSKNAEKDPHSSGVRIAVNDLEAAAKARGLSADWGIVSQERTRMIEQVSFFVNRLEVPLVACQRFSEHRPHLGHYRVITGATSEAVTLHDPHPQSGGPSLTWSYDELERLWRPSGKNVIGGIALWISKSIVSDDPLVPTRSSAGLWPSIHNLVVELDAAGAKARDG